MKHVTARVFRGTNELLVHLQRYNQEERDAILELAISMYKDEDQEQEPEPEFPERRRRLNAGTHKAQPPTVGKFYPGLRGPIRPFTSRLGRLHRKYDFPRGRVALTDAQRKEIHRTVRAFVHNKGWDLPTFERDFTQKVPYLSRGTARNLFYGIPYDGLFSRTIYGLSKYLGITPQKLLQSTEPPPGAPKSHRKARKKTRK